MFSLICKTNNQAPFYDIFFALYVCYKKNETLTYCFSDNYRKDQHFVAIFTSTVGQKGIQTSEIFC